MRRFIIILVLSGLVSTVLCQDKAESLSDLFETLSSSIPEDQVYLHTDRNHYNPGDTIFFQSYIRNRFTKSHNTSSLSIYAILCNEESEVIDSARFRIQYSLAPGWLLLPADIKSGYYKLTAFTSSMQNYKPEYAYSSWIRIGKLVPDPVRIDFRFNKQSYMAEDTVEVEVSIRDNLNEPVGNMAFYYSFVLNGRRLYTYNSKTNRRGESLLRIYLPDSVKYNKLALELSLSDMNYLSRISIPLVSADPDLKFLPEGGSFIYNFKQRLAFNAVDHSGKQLIIKGIVKDDLGNTIDSIISGDYGPGMVELNPLPGRSYHAELEGYNNLIWKLPVPSSNGPALRVESTKNIMKVDIMGSDPAENTYYLVLSSNYNIILYRPVQLTGVNTLRLDTEDIPAGTGRFTLFDNSLRPVAERLVYINRHREIDIDISPTYEFYVSGQDAEIEIFARDQDGEPVSGLFSISVIDSTIAYYPDLPFRNIEDIFLYDEQFYNNLPGKLQSTGLVNIPPQSIDLLLMTYGWRRFNWVDRSTQDHAHEMVRYDLLKVNVLDRMTKRRIKMLEKTSEDLFLITLENPELHTLTTITNNSYYFLFDSLPPFNNSIMIAPNNTSSRYINTVKVEFPYNPEYINSIKESNNSPPINLRDDFSLSKEFDFDLDSIRVIEGITVLGKRTTAQEFINEHEEMYQAASLITVDHKVLSRAIDFEDILRDLFPRRLDVVNQTIHFGGPRSFSGGDVSPPALFVLDGVPVENNYSTLFGLIPQTLHSVTALKGVQGFFLYGSRATDGVVFVETKFGNMGGEYDITNEMDERLSGDLVKPITIYRSSIEFYNPPKEEINDNPEYWLMPTIYWDHNIFLNGEAPTIINYTNHLKKGTVFILINGVSFENQPAVGFLSYIIR